MARKKKAVSIKLVAKEADVSVATVSRVINNRTDVSESVRKRVQSIIDKFNFSPTKSSERRVNIGVILSVENPVVDEYTAQVLDGITRYSGESNLDATIVVNCFNLNPVPLLQIIRERRCDAVVLIFPEKVINEIKDLDQAAIPTILVNTDIMQGEKIGYVNNTSYKGALAAVNLLIQMGHRKIGFLSGSLENSRNHQERLDGYKDAINKAGIEIAPDWIVYHQPTIRTPEAGYKQAQKLLNSSPDITAIFAANDEMAFGALKACWDNGRRVPEDISVVGFDDIPYSSYMHPALTTVRQPISNMGYNAMKYLDLYLKGHIDKLPTEVLDTELVIRQSTAPAASN